MRCGLSATAGEEEGVDWEEEEREMRRWDIFLD